MDVVENILGHKEHEQHIPKYERDYEKHRIRLVCAECGKPLSGWLKNGR